MWSELVRPGKILRKEGYQQNKNILVCYINKSFDGEASEVIWQGVHEDGYVKTWKNIQRAGITLIVCFSMHNSFNFCILMFKFMIS